MTAAEWLWLAAAALGILALALAIPRPPEHTQPPAPREEWPPEAYRGQRSHVRIVACLPGCPICRRDA